MIMQQPICLSRVLSNASRTLPSGVEALLVAVARVTNETVTVAGKLVRHTANLDAPSIGPSPLADLARITFYRTPRLESHARTM